MSQPLPDRPDLSDNPFLRIENPYEDPKLQERQQQASLKAAEFQRLCHSVFHEYADGKRLWEMWRDMYLMENQVDPTGSNSSNLSLWWDGFKSCGLGFYNHGLMHIKRVNGVG